MHRIGRHLDREGENGVNISTSTSFYSYYLTLKTAQCKVIKELKAMRMKRKQTIERRKEGTSKCSIKETNRNVLRGDTAADFGQKKIEDTHVDEDKLLFLLFLLQSFRQFNDEKKFLARM